LEQTKKEMKHLEDLRDAGIGCMLMISGVILLVALFEWLISLIL
jgi:hypothetical protein